MSNSGLVLSQSEEKRSVVREKAESQQNTTAAAGRTTSPFEYPRLLHRIADGTLPPPFLSNAWFDLATGLPCDLPFAGRERDLAYRTRLYPVPATADPTDVLAWLNTLVGHYSGYPFRGVLAGKDGSDAGDRIDFKQRQQELDALARSLTEGEAKRNERLIDAQIDLEDELETANARVAILELAVLLTDRICADTVAVPVLDVPSECTVLDCEQRLLRLRKCVKDAVQAMRPFAAHPELLELAARRHLKGNQLVIAEQVACRGRVPLAEFAIVCDWPEKWRDAWRSARRELNDKFRPYGWRFGTAGGCAVAVRLPAIAGSKVGHV